MKKSGARAGGLAELRARRRRSRQREEIIVGEKEARRGAG